VIRTAKMTMGTGPAFASQAFTDPHSSVHAGGAGGGACARSSEKNVRRTRDGTTRRTASAARSKATESSTATRTDPGATEWSGTCAGGPENDDREEGCQTSPRSTEITGVGSSDRPLRESSRAVSGDGSAPFGCGLASGAVGRALGGTLVANSTSAARPATRYIAVNKSHMIGLNYTGSARCGQHPRPALANTTTCTIVETGRARPLPEPPANGRVPCRFNLHCRRNTKT